MSLALKRKKNLKEEFKATKIWRFKIFVNPNSRWKRFYYNCFLSVYQPNTVKYEDFFEIFIRQIFNWPLNEYTDILILDFLSRRLQKFKTQTWDTTELLKPDPGKRFGVPSFRCDVKNNMAVKWSDTYLEKYIRFDENIWHKRKSGLRTQIVQRRDLFCEDL